MKLVINYNFFVLDTIFYQNCSTKIYFLKQVLDTFFVPFHYTKNTRTDGKGTTINGLEKRKLIITIIDYLKNNLDSSIEDIYKHLHPIIKKHVIGLPGLQKVKSIHKSAFKDFVPFLSKQTKISSKIRTIHQSKGDEFKHVLLYLNDKTDKNGGIRKKLETILEDYIFNAKSNIVLDSEVGEETRLIYVACSRAQERLFINVPRLSTEEEHKMDKLGVRIIRN